MSRQTLLKAYLCHCLAWGNGYIEIQRDAGNQVVGLWPRNPWKTRPRRMVTALHLPAEPWRPFPINLTPGTMVYQTTDGLDDFDHAEIDSKSQQARIIPAEDMLHVPGIAFDGRVGQSTVWLARQTIGLALATEKFGAKYFGNFARPGGILEMPAMVKKEDRDQAKLSWQEAQGGENSNRIAVMPPGFKWTQISNNPQEAQTTEARAAIRNEIASIFHVPVRMVGDTSKGSKSSTEQENQEMLDYTLSPWLSAIRLEWKRKLFPHSGIGRKPKNHFYVDFDITGMIRGDAASREKFNASMKQWGYGNTNDVRALEGMNPIDQPWAEQYWMPINMTLTTTPIDPTFQDGAGNGDVPDNARDDKPPAAGKDAPPAKKGGKDAPVKNAYSRLFNDAFGRILARDKRDNALFLRCFGPVLFAARDAVRIDAQVDLMLETELPPVGGESDRFIGEYLHGMASRSKDWTAEGSDEVSSRELDRAIRAIRIAVYREVATAKAKEESLDVAA
jgi:HK97 family phage portal protein